MKTLFLLVLSYIIIFAYNSEAFAATASDPPTNLTATAVSSTRVNLFWSAPTNDGGTGVNSYKIEYRIGSGSYPLFKETVKTAITPMLSTLSILNYANIDSESEMLGYGIGIILLNAAMYLGVPAFLILVIKGRIKAEYLKKS